MAPLLPTKSFLVLFLLYFWKWMYLNSKHNLIAADTSALLMLCGNHRNIVVPENSPSRTRGRIRRLPSCSGKTPPMDTPVCRGWRLVSRKRGSWQLRGVQGSPALQHTALASASV